MCGLVGGDRRSKRMSSYSEGRVPQTPHISYAEHQYSRPPTPATILHRSEQHQGRINLINFGFTRCRQCRGGVVGVWNASVVEAVRLPFIFDTATHRQQGRSVPIFSNVRTQKLGSRGYISVTLL